MIVIAIFIIKYRKWPETCLTILPLFYNVPDWIILSSSPAKANILLGEEKFLISPYSDKIVAADISPNPVMDNILGLSSLIIIEICLSIGSIFL